MTPLPTTPTVRPVSSLPPMVKGFAWWSIVLTVITFAVKAFCAFVLHLTGVYRQIVFARSLLFVDFQCFVYRFRDFHHTTFFAFDAAHGLPFTYPASAALPYQFFYLLPHSLIFFLTFSVGGIVAAAIAFRGILIKHGLGRGVATFLIAAALLCSYPLYVELFLCNIEMVIVFIVAGGIYLFLTGRSRWAAICFGVGGAIKLFPFIFFALLLKRKQYREIAIGICIAVMLQVFSLWLISSNVVISWHGINNGLEYLRRIYILGPYKHDIGIDHSLWGLYKGWLIVSNHAWPSIPKMGSQLRIYVLGTAILGLILYVRIRTLPVLNLLLALTIIGVLFTACSKDYTLLHLYVPLGMLVLLSIEAFRSGRKIPGMAAMFVCMTLLLAPLSEFVYNGLIFGAQIKAVVLSVFLALVLTYPLVSPRETATYAPLG